MYMLKTTKKIVSLLVLFISPIIMFYVFFNIYKEYTSITLGTILWILFAFLSGLFLASSRNVYPFIISLTTDSKSGSHNKISRRIFSFTSGVILSLVAISVVLSLAGMEIQGAYIESGSQIRIGFYILIGLIGYIISLSNFHFFNIDKLKKYPNLFNKKFNYFNLFFIGFVSVYLDLISSTILIGGETLLRGDIHFCIIVFLSHAIGRVFPLLIVETFNRFKIDAQGILSNIKGTISIISNGLIILVSSLMLHVGAIVLFESISYGENNVFLNFLYDGWFLIIILLLPLWIKFFIEESRVFRSPILEFNQISKKIKEVSAECNNLKHIYNFKEKKIGEKLNELKNKLNLLIYDSKIVESSIRYSAKYPIRGFADQKREEEGLKKRLLYTISLTIITITIISIIVS